MELRPTRRLTAKTEMRLTDMADQFLCFVLSARSPKPKLLRMRTAPVGRARRSVVRVSKPRDFIRIEERSVSPAEGICEERTNTTYIQV